MDGTVDKIVIENVSDEEGECENHDLNIYFSSISH